MVAKDILRYLPQAIVPTLDININEPTALNRFNQNAEWAVSSADQTHLLSISGVYELPFGQGRAFFGNHGFVSRQLIGGWQVSGVFQYESGTPFGISASGTPLETGGNRANVVPGVPVSFELQELLP